MGIVTINCFKNIILNKSDIVLATSYIFFYFRAYFNIYIFDRRSLKLLHNF